MNPNLLTTRVRRAYGQALISWAVVALLLAPLCKGFAQSDPIVIKTLGGGPLLLGGPAFGFSDGDGIQNSQFNHPVAVLADPSGGLLVADATNGAIRRILVATTATSTVLSDLARPVDLLLDQSTNLFVLTQKDGLVTKYDPDFNPVEVVASGLVEATAMTMDGRGNLYVAEQRGWVRRFSPDGSSAVLLQGLHAPQGLDVLDNGFLVVSDTEEHAIKLINPLTGALSLLSGGNGPGFLDGPGAKAKFNRPHHVAKAPNGALVVADRSNNRIRLVQTNGATTTLFGMSSTQWNDCPSCYPGWFDGTNAVAEIREPYGVAVAADGTVYDTEVFYHLVRSGAGGATKALGIAGAGSGPGSALTPSIFPKSGYYPMGQLISVSAAANTVYYTTDGSEPTTNSPSIQMDARNQGSLYWSDPLRDLTSLRLKAVAGTNSSPTISGEPSAVNQIGLPSDVTAGVGSTIVLPVVVNLRSNDLLKSLQFRVEASPVEARSGPIGSLFRALNVGSNDFVRVATADSSTGGRASFSTISGSIGDTRVLSVSFIGTNSNFSIHNYAVVAMVAVPIPPTALPGERYRVAVREPSATADGQQAGVSLVSMPDRFITITQHPYLVGDTAFASWYNAGTFGDGDLRNDDINNVFNASLGVRVPYDFTDLFNAMDVFPEDTVGLPGGDGQIRFLDWQTLLMRSLRLRPGNWIRSWSESGVRSTQPAALSGAPLTSSALSKRLPGSVWVRQARLFGRGLENVSPGNVVDVPVYLRVAAGAEVSGLQFRVMVSPVTDGPSLDRPAEFISATGLTQPARLDGVPTDQVACGWSLGAFNPALKGEILLGTVRFKVPSAAVKGTRYSVRFLNADGAPDLFTQYDFESLQTDVWILSKALTPAEAIPADWKLKFFGNVLGPESADDADPDQDGLSNLQEFAAGTDPTVRGSRPLLFVQTVENAAQVRLGWLSAPGKRYAVDRSDTLRPAAQWRAVGDSILGTGDYMYLEDGAPVTGSVGFYRLRVLP